MREMTRKSRHRIVNPIANVDVVLASTNIKNTVNLVEKIVRVDRTEVEIDMTIEGGTIERNVGRRRVADRGVRPERLIIGGDTTIDVIAIEIVKGNIRRHLIRIRKANIRKMIEGVVGRVVVISVD